MDSYWEVSLEEEYARDEKLKESDVAIIQDWMLEQTHLPKLTDHQIVLFLSACKYDLEVTKKTIDLNYTLRTKMPEFFSDRNVNSEWSEIAIKHSYFAMMPKDSKGNAVVAFKLKPMEISNWNHEEYTKFSIMMQDVCNLKYGAVPGYVLLQDMEHLTFSQMIRMSNKHLSDVMKYSQEASACQIKNMHILNAGIVVEKLFVIISPFLSEDFKKMIKIHHNYESLREAVDPTLLPSDYGGTHSTLENLHEEAMNALKKLQPWFDEEAKQRVDESKRIKNKTKNSGFMGFFRKKEID